MSLVILGKDLSQEYILQELGSFNEYWQERVLSSLERIRDPEKLGFAREALEAIADLGTWSSDSKKRRNGEKAQQLLSKMGR